MNSAVIVAGGTGKRFGGEIPKQFTKIKGKELIAYSINTFLNHPQIDEVVIVTHPGWINHVQSNYPDCIVTIGGERRQDSSFKGVKATSADVEIVLIHDAARPFVSEKIITNCLSALENADGSAPILDSPDSLVKWNGKSAAFVNRSEVKLVQTPQCFKRELILNILSANIQSTDEIGMVLKAFPESKLKFVLGNPMNTKITTDLDLQYISNLQK